MYFVSGGFAKWAASVLAMLNSVAETFLLDLAKRSPRSRLADFRASCPNALQQAVNFLLSRAAHRRANADICGAVVS